MKKLLVALALVLAPFTATAQNAISKVTMQHVETKEEMDILVVNTPFIEDLPTLLREAFETTGIKVVTLHSPGGRADIAFEVGQLFDEFGITVWVPRGRVCLSACAIAFLGAHEYIIEGQLGFHNAHTDWSNITSENVEEYYNTAQLYGAQQLYWLNLNGFSSQLAININTKTTINDFIVFSTTEELLTWYVRNEEEAKDTVTNYLLPKDFGVLIANGDTIYSNAIDQQRELEDGDFTYSPIEIETLWESEVSE